MKLKNVGFIVILLIFIVAGALSWRLYFKVYSQDDTVDISVFPKTINNWESEELPLTETEKAILETDNAFVRRYFNPAGQEVYLFIVYSENNRKVSHPPEVCYTGSGAVILDNQPDSVISQADNTTVDARRLTAEIQDRKQVIFYWFKVGDSFTPSYWKQQGLIAMKSFLGQPSSSAMVRLSAMAKEEDLELARKSIKDFGQIIIPHLYKHLP